MWNPREGSTNWGESEITREAEPSYKKAAYSADAGRNGVGSDAAAVSRTGERRSPTRRKRPASRLRAAPWIGDVFHRRAISQSLDWTPTVPRSKTIYSTCALCASACGIAAELSSGTVRRLEGNPYHPLATEPHVRYSMPVALGKTWPQPHPLCDLGSRGLHILYDPFRLSVPLKRSGPRGSGRWKIISWEQLISEIVSGGALFSEVDGEEDRTVEGFAAIFEGGRGQREPIDAADPRLGPKTNGVVISYDGSVGGRADILRRFANSFGTLNLEGPETAFELSRSCGTKQSLDGATALMVPDISNCRYLLYFGSDPLAVADRGSAKERKLNSSVARGELMLKVVDADPAQSYGEPERIMRVRPGGHGALAMGMVRSMMEKGLYDEESLSLPTRSAADRAMSPTFSNAAWLVIADPGHQGYGRFLDPASAGLAGTSSHRSPRGSSAVVIDPKSGLPVQTEHAPRGELWPAGKLSRKPVQVNGVACLSSFQLLYQEACSHSMKEYSLEAGVAPEEIARLAEEFASYARMAVADCGPGRSMSGQDPSFFRTIMTLNFLAGNLDWMGGLITGGGSANCLGEREGAAYALASWPRKPAGLPSGIAISKVSGLRGLSGGTGSSANTSRASYEAKGSCPEPEQERLAALFSGIGQGRPYRTKILIRHGPCPADMAIIGSGGEEVPWWRIASDLESVPLFIAIDTVLSESSSHADYVVPDTSYLESWGFPVSVLPVPTKAQGIQQPAAEPLTARTASGQPMCMEQLLIDISKELGLSGFGKDAFWEGGSLDSREDYYLKMAANVACDPSFLGWKSGGLAELGAVPNASTDELRVIGEMRGSHPHSLTSAHWHKVAYVLSRGGRFENYEAAYQPNPDSQARLTRLIKELISDDEDRLPPQGNGILSPSELRALFSDAMILPVSSPTNSSWTAHRYGERGAACRIYDDELATARDPVSGELLCGTARYERSRNQDEPRGSNREKASSLLDQRGDELPLDAPLAGGAEPLRENIVRLCSLDARRFGLYPDARVVLWPSSLSAEEGISARLEICEGVEPGQLELSLGFWGGRTAMRALDEGGGTTYRLRTAPQAREAAAEDTSLAEVAELAAGLPEMVAGAQLKAGSTAVEKAR